MEIKSIEKSCPVSEFTEMLGGKWKLIIISRLRSRGKMRFGQIAATIPLISRKVLTDQLKDSGAPFLDFFCSITETEYAVISFSLFLIILSIS